MLFAVHLLLGDTFNGVFILVMIVRNYLTEAAKIVQDTDHNIPDPQYDRKGKQVETIKAILLFAASLEDEPSRQECFARRVL